jgi:hypothetical protein
MLTIDFIMNPTLRLGDSRAMLEADMKPFDF